MKKIKVLLKKSIGMIFRKIKPKKYGKMSYSQCGEDLIVDFILKILKINNPTYLDIGSYLPQKINNTYLFYKKGGHGVGIEPDPGLHAKHIKFRKKDISLNIGIGAEEKKSAEFYMMSSKTLNTFSKEEAMKYESCGKQKIEKKIEIPLKTANWVMEKYFDKCPNFISIDVEGLDLAILKTFDFKKFRPEIICVETISYTENNTEKKDYEIIDLMKKNNYMLYADTYINSIFVDLEKWKKRTPIA